MIASRTTVGFAALCLLVCTNASSNAATCGAKEVRDIIETQSADRIKMMKIELEGTNIRNKFGDDELRFLSKELKFSANNNYQVGEDGDVKHCKGILSILSAGGTGINLNISYDVISTEDGNTMVRQEDISHESPAEAGAQLLMSLSTPKTPSSME